MIFYSDSFTFNNVYSKDNNICLVTQNTDVLNEYGISKDADEPIEITLSFCYATSEGIPLSWEYDTLKTFLEWVITDEYCEFISEDNEDIIYFLKGEGYKKNFTSEMKGIIDVTFKALSPYGYMHYVREVMSGEGSFDMVNHSNLDGRYKPVITLKNISSESVSISNNSSDKAPLAISKLVSGRTVYIDNKLGTITDFNGNNIINNSNRSWIELKKGTNSFSVQGLCDMLIEAYYPVMV